MVIPGGQDDINTKIARYRSQKIRNRNLETRNFHWKSKTATSVSTPHFIGENIPDPSGAMVKVADAVEY